MDTAVPERVQQFFGLHSLTFSLESVKIKEIHFLGGNNDGSNHNSGAL